ncbi:MAG: hypothetical protein JWP12_3651 [Bacteroidetes bacterium]|nr:hypothetical protein [Bacteroidota bacterium]
MRFYNFVQFQLIFLIRESVATINAGKRKPQSGFETLTEVE